MSTLAQHHPIVIGMSSTNTIIGTFQIIKRQEMFVLTQQDNCNPICCDSSQSEALLEAVYSACAEGELWNAFQCASSLWKQGDCHGSRTEVNSSAQIKLKGGVKQSRADIKNETHNKPGATILGPGLLLNQRSRLYLASCRHAHVVRRRQSAVPASSRALSHCRDVLGPPPLLPRMHREETCIRESQVSQNAFRNNQRQRRQKLPTVVIMIIL